MGRAQAFPPLREGGAASGGGGSTAGCRWDKRLFGRSAKNLRARMALGTTAQSGINCRIYGDPGGPGSVRAVSTGHAWNRTGTRLSRGRDKARPSRCGIQKVKDKAGLRPTASRNTPPVAAPATCLPPSGNILPWPRHPPLGGGSVPKLEVCGHSSLAGHGGGGVRSVAAGTSQAVRRRKRPGSPVSLRTAKGHQSSRRWNCSLWSQEWMARDRK